MNQPCNLVNKVWVERGMLLCTIHQLQMNRISLGRKVIIVPNANFRTALQELFPELVFASKAKGNDSSFHICFRTQATRHRALVFDYLANYEQGIPAKNVALVPWYDMNDPLIVFKYNGDGLVDANRYRQRVIQFSRCKRGAYPGSASWDDSMEKQILSFYLRNNPGRTMQQIVYVVDSALIGNFTNTVVEKLIYVPVQTNQQPAKEREPSAENADAPQMQQLIDIMNGKLASLNQLLT